MRRRYIWLSLVVGLVIFLFLLKEVSWREVLTLFQHANLIYLAIYFGTSCVVMLLLATRWQIILKAKNVKLPFWTAVNYRLAGFAASFVTPGPRVGGEAVTAALLTRHKAGRKKIRFSQAFSTIVIDRAVEVQTFAILFFIGVLALAMLDDIPSGLRIIMIASSVLLLILMVLFVWNITQGKPFFTRILGKFASKKIKHELKHFEDTIVTFYKHDRTEFILAHVVAGIAWLISLIEFKYLLLFLSFDVPLYGVFIVYSFVGLAYAMPIPLALGSLEGGQAAAFSLIGLPSAGGFILALITRIRDMFFTIIGFMILAYYGIAPRTVQKTVR